MLLRLIAALLLVSAFNVLVIIGIGFLRAFDVPSPATPIHFIIWLLGTDVLIFYISIRKGKPHA